MAGAPGRSGGHNRKPLAHHVAAGTYRRDRHGAVPASVLPMPKPPATEWAPTEADLTDIGPRGQVWIDAVQALYRLDQLEGLQLMNAARCLTRVELLEDAIAELGVATPEGVPHPLLAALAREQRVFLSVWAIALPREK